MVYQNFWIGSKKYLDHRWYLHIVELIAFKNAYILINSFGGETMHWAPIWYPYIDREKSTIKKKILKPDTPQEIRDAFEKHQEELKKPVHGFVDK